jgi:hypothetical protein
LGAVDIGAAVLDFGDTGQFGFDEFWAKSVVTAETHDERSPRVRVDAVLVVTHKDSWIDMDAFDADFEAQDAR